MMTLRRFLTAKYDWTGITSKLSTSKTLSILAYLVAGAIMTLLIVLFHGPIITDKVELNTFAPAHLVHLFDLTVAGSVAVILFSNLFRMYWFTMHPGSSAKIPDVIKGYIKDGLGYTMHQGTKVRITLRMYLTEFKTFLQHVTTQKQFLSCPSESSKSRWLKHFFIFLGYVIMFSLVVVFLEWFQTDEIYPIYHPQRWVGYFAAAALIIFTGEIIVGRMRKRDQIHKFSDISDWMFPMLLFLMAFTGIVVHVFRLMGLPLATYYSYAIHLIVAFIWLVVIIPFGKWTHLLYRSFAIYFQHVKERAVQNHLKKEVVLDHAA